VPVARGIARVPAARHLAAAGRRRRPGATFGHDVPVRTVRPVRNGPESVFSVHLCWESPDTSRNLDLPGALAFPGVTPPDLAAHLRGVEDTVDRHWPHDARLLRALISSGDNHIGPALERYARLPGYDPAPAALDRLLDGPSPQSLVRLDTHIAQVARYIDEFFGYDQWFIFDTRWAAAHPDLARSLLRYARQWDPFAP
jgi:hypothetical protein